MLIRAAYALGGLGSGFAENEEEFRAQAEKGLAYSDQLIVDQVRQGFVERGKAGGAGERGTGEEEETRGTELGGRRLFNFIVSIILVD